LKEPLRRAFGATLRILAARPDPPGGPALLAALPDAPDAAARSLWRGRIDALALRTRLSDAALHARTAPVEARRQALFDALEQARVEALGAILPGVRANLAQFPRPAPAEGALLLRAARARWGAPATRMEAADAISLPQAALEAPPIGPAARKIDAMAALLHDQWAFAMAGLDLVSLAFAESGGPDAAPNPEAAADRRPSQGPPQRAGAPGGRRAQHGSAERPPGEVGRDEAAPDEAAREAAFETLRADAGADADGAARRAGARWPVGGDDRAFWEAALPYRVYTREFDRVLDNQERRRTGAEPFAPEDRHRNRLREELARSRANFARWAHRLQRHLMVRQMRAWQFDTEEGLLDAARLTRIVTDPTQPLSFKQERPDEFPATAVTLLIDCSGSMRGPPIATAAGCAELLVAVLERCGIQAEILGFTTRRWRGGEARARWLAEGRPREPGRLADLLHIVFKRGSTPWRRARRSFATILDDELLKENIDGEALLWAHERLLRRAEPRKILLVVSDGAPLDDATLAANDPGYLDRHLRAVIGRIETRSPVELLAIGIGHNVGAYYPRSFTVTGAQNLGEALVTQLIALLDAPRRRPASAAF
jgi:cobaltochelatase CobT